MTRREFIVMLLCVFVSMSAFIWALDKYGHQPIERYVSNCHSTGTECK